MSKIPIPPTEDLKGYTITQLVLKYKVSQATIVKWRRIRGIAKIRSDRIPVPPIKDLKGKTMEELIAKYKVGRSIIMIWLRYNGLSNSRNERIKNLHEELKNVKRQNELLRIAFILPFLRDAQISRALGITREYVRRLRNNMQIKYVNIHDKMSTYEKEAET